MRLAGGRRGVPGGGQAASIQRQRMRSGSLVIQRQQGSLHVEHMFVMG